MVKFNYLDVPDQYNQYFTKYPQGYTILEALLNWVQQVDDMVTNVNDWNTYLDNFVLTFDAELQEKVTETLSDWQASGFLTTIINNALSTKVSYIRNVTEYGAIGDGIADDTTAILNTIAAATEGQTVKVPMGTFRTTQTILINKNINFLCDGIILSDHDGIAIEFKDLGRNTDINNTHIVSVKKKNLNHTLTTAVGVKLNGCYSQKIDIKQARDFYYGVLLDADLGKGCVYNDIALKAIYNNKVQVFLTGLQNGGLDSQKAWVNQNTFYGGRLSWSGTVGTRIGYVGIQIGKDATGYLPNGNLFLNTSIEDVGYNSQYATAIQCFGHDNQFIATRTEGSLDMIFDAVSYNNKVQGGFYTTLKNITDNGLKNEFDFVRGGMRKWTLNLQDITEFIGSGAGVPAARFYNKTSSSNDALEVMESDGTTTSFYVKATGEIGYRKNVKHVYGLYNAPPTTGTWQRNDVVWRNNPSPNQYIGWVCTTGGVDLEAVWKGFGMIEA